MVKEMYKHVKNLLKRKRVLQIKLGKCGGKREIPADFKDW
jgi:hypothetical protein